MDEGKRKMLANLYLPFERIIVALADRLFFPEQRSKKKAQVEKQDECLIDSTHH